MSDLPLQPTTTTTKKGDLYRLGLHQHSSTSRVLLLLATLKLVVCRGRLLEDNLLVYSAFEFKKKYLGTLFKTRAPSFGTFERYV